VAAEQFTIRQVQAVSTSPSEHASEPRAVTPRELQAVIAQQRLGEPFVSYRDAEGALALHPLEGVGELIVGREPPAGILVSWDSQVSRAHCVLARVGAEWTVEDDGLSRNGTYLNGARITARARLRGGDLIRIGRSALTFNDPRSAVVDGTEIAIDVVSITDLTPTQRHVLVALCRPLLSGSSTPATNPDIGGEVFLGVDAVKVHLRALFRKFDLEDLAQNEKRGRLAETAIRLGLVTERDL